MNKVSTFKRQHQTLLRLIPTRRPLSPRLIRQHPLKIAQMLLGTPRPSFLIVPLRPVLGMDFQGRHLLVRELSKCLNSLPGNGNFFMVIYIGLGLWVDDGDLLEVRQIPERKKRLRGVIGHVKPVIRVGERQRNGNVSNLCRPSLISTHVAEALEFGAANI